MIEWTGRAGRFFADVIMQRCRRCLSESGIDSLISGKMGRNWKKFCVVNRFSLQ